MCQYVKVLILRITPWLCKSMSLFLGYLHKIIKYKRHDSVTCSQMVKKCVVYKANVQAAEWTRC